MKTKLLAPHDEVLWKLSFVEFHLFITSGETRRCSETFPTRKETAESPQTG